MVLTAPCRKIIIKYRNIKYKTSDGQDNCYTEEEHIYETQNHYNIFIHAHMLESIYFWYLKKSYLEDISSIKQIFDSYLYIMNTYIIPDKLLIAKNWFDIL